jgi:hypothetical protein
VSGFLLDTNVLSEFSRTGEPNPRVRAWLRAVPPELLYASVVTTAEIKRGIEFLPAGKRRYATSGSLVIVSLAEAKIREVPGVNEVYVIATGPHRDELICVRRVCRKAPDGGEYPAYPFIHARADGQPIREVSDEWAGQYNVLHDKMPVLRNYLRSIGGTISVNGETLP